MPYPLSFYRIANVLVLAFALVLPIAAAHAQDYPTNANGLPLLHSNPGAAGKLYIDFDGGDTIWDTDLAPYGGDSTFDTTEQSQIYNAWLDVGTHFAIFDLDVTTEVSDTSLVPTSTLMVSNDASGGESAGARYGTVNSKASATVRDGSVISRSTEITHEFGHNIVLGHQADYDDDGNYVSDYRLSSRDPWNRGAIMGLDWQGKFSAWTNGPLPANSLAEASYQNDIAKIAEVIIAKAIDFFGSYSGDGFRPDDHGNTFGSATTLTEDIGQGNLISYNASGIIERFGDKDVFAFSHGGGDVSVTVEAVKNVAANPVYASSLGMNMILFNSLGNTIDFDLAVDPADVDASLNLSLAAGDYFVRIQNYNDYEDRGAYLLDIEAIAVVSTPLGDFNDDGNVDGADFLVWQQGFGDTYTADDLVDWKANFGTVAASAASTSTVPEPSSLALLGMGAWALGFAARRQRK